MSRKIRAGRHLRVSLLAIPLSLLAAGTAAAAGVTPWIVDAAHGPESEVAIDVREGTWMSVDIAPDGRSLVFDLLGDIHVVPIAGGEARQLTSGRAWEMQPRFSPDGRHILFTSDRGGGDNLWVMDRDGSNARAITTERFRLLSGGAWTPDGRHVLGRKNYTGRRSYGAGEIWMYDLAGGPGVRVVARRTSEKDVNEPAVSPDGRYLYYSEDVTPGERFEYNRDSNTELYQIRRLDLKTGDTLAYVTGPGGSIRPTPSPDGRKLAFIRRDRYVSYLHVLELSDGSERRVAQLEDRDLQEGWAIHGVYPSMAWTPDSRSLVYWTGGQIRLHDLATGEARAVPIHVSKKMAVAAPPSVAVAAASPRFAVRAIQSVRLSPSGDEIAFQAMGTVWKMSLGLGQPQRLTKTAVGRQIYPNWTSDGQVMFATWSDDGLGTLQQSSVSGNRRELKMPKGRYAQSALAPGSHWLAFVRPSGEGLVDPRPSRESGLYLQSLPAGVPRLLSTDGEQPVFSADGKRLRYVSRLSEADQELREIDLETRRETVIAKVRFAGEISMSPDERWIAWTERHDAYVARRAATGAPQELGATAFGATRLSTQGGGSLSWSADSRWLGWSWGSTFYRCGLDNEAMSCGDASRHSAFPIQLSEASDRSTKRFLLSGARILTMRGDEVIEEGDILVAGNRIERVGPHGQVAIAPDVEVVDLSGKTIIPGLVDMHWHGQFGEGELIPEQGWPLLASLAFGITTVHDPSSNNGSAFAAAELARAGRILSPRIFTTGSNLQGAETPNSANIDSKADAVDRAVRQQSIGANGVKSYNLPRRDQRQQLASAARERGMYVVPESGAIYMHVLTNIVDGHSTIEHSVPLSRIYEDVRQLWSGSRTRYTPTVIVSYGGVDGENYWYQHGEVWNDPRLASLVPHRLLDSVARRNLSVPLDELHQVDVAKTAKSLLDRGVSIQAGGHGQREGLGLHWEMWSLAQGGLTPLEAIRSATFAPAQALGLDHDLGSIEAGKLADLVVLSGDPRKDLKNTTNIAFIVLNGRRYDPRLNEVGGQPRRPLFFEKDGGDVWPTRGVPRRGNAN